MNDFYNDYGSWMRQQLPFKVQKLSVNAGFSCPNRDGTIGTDGCIYCNNRTFNPSYCAVNETVSEQLERGKKFFGKKYNDMKYLAYFQSYTNTYAHLTHLKRLYDEALSVPDVVGIVIATRPDCVSGELLDYLTELNRRTFLIVEYGIESTNDDTLRFIRRGHTFEICRKTVVETVERGITTCGHIILGLPGEDTDECLRQANVVSSLPLDILKLHQLQVIKGTKLAEMYAQKPFHTYSADEYIDLVIGYIRRLRNTMVLERFVSQSPADMVVAPRWGLKNHEFTHRLLREMRLRKVRQGDLCAAL